MSYESCLARLKSLSAQPFSLAYGGEAVTNIDRDWTRVKDTSSPGEAGCTVYERGYLAPDGLIALTVSLTEFPDTGAVEWILYEDERPHGRASPEAGGAGHPGVPPAGAGGCRVCPSCARVQNQPCRHPERAMSSFEAYGINVSALAPKAGMKYINGPDTVTFFGGVLLEER